MIFRGVNLGPLYGDADVRARLDSSTAAGSNVVRWLLFMDPPFAEICTIQQWRDWLDGELVKVSMIVPKFTELGISMILCLFNPPGGKRLWTQIAWQNEFVLTWQKIATCCYMQPNVPLYDLLNEPLPGQTSQWVNLAKRAISAIWTIEPQKKIALSSKGGAPNQLAYLPFIQGITYTFHFYDPGNFTGQGIPFPGFPKYPRSYTAYDMNNIRITMQRVAMWQRTLFHGAEIYVGELDCVRWAPNNGAYKWMHDVIYWLNTYHWHWTFLAWEDPEATFWDQAFSTEYCPDGSCATVRTHTDRIQLLERGFKGMVQSL